MIADVSPITEPNFLVARLVLLQPGFFRRSPETNHDNFLKLESTEGVAPLSTESGSYLSTREKYRGYEIEVEPDGGGHYLSARPLHPGTPILSCARMKVLCSQERALAIVRTAVDRLLDNR